jgi:RHS repeat-associated protein
MGSGVTEKHRFTTYERDGETATDYGMNRQHSTGAGRFMQPDPVAGDMGTPQSLNLYAYALGDPVNLMDPSGLSPGPQGSVDDLKNSIYGNKSLLQKINGCLRKLLGENFSKVGKQKLANSPHVYWNLASKAIQSTFKMRDTPYSAGVGNWGGPADNLYRIRVVQQGE